MPKPYVTGRNILLSVGPRPHRLGLKDLQRRARWFRRRYQRIKANTYATVYGGHTQEEVDRAAKARRDASWDARRAMDTVIVRLSEIERGKA